MKKHLALIALIAAPLLAGCGGSPSSDTGTPPPGSEQQNAAEPTVGTPFTADMGGGNVAKITIVTAQFVDTVSANQFAPKPKSGKFLQLDVLWETEKGKTSANPLYFNVKDAEGRKADMQLFGDGTLASGEVIAGDKARGFVNYDVAPGPVTVTVTNPGLQTVATVKITP
ncbi:hypothetical protein ACLRGI_06975 [Paenarthrobacter nitroguajacolicus]|uniref:hypothetical protein n=1 Tax=Paenarthrobacter nitroguajacolicus TaxID=211146 RepID=UPI003AE18A9E